MPNKFKYNKTGAETNSSFKGNWAIDNTPANTGGGPSSATSFYHGANIPPGGYAIYSPNGVFIAANDTQLVGKVNSLGANVTGASGAFTWAAGQSTHMILNAPINNIVTNALVLNADASSLSSFNDNQPTINKATNAATFNGGWGSYVHGNDGTFTTEFGTTGYRMSNRGSWNGVYMNFNIGSAGIHTFSAWIKYLGNAAPVTGGAVYISNYGGGDVASAVDKSLVGIWQRVSIIVNVTSPSNVYFYLISWGGTYGGDNHSWEVTMPQIETGSILKPFVNGTRSQNTLWYDSSNNNNTITLINGPTIDSNKGLSFDGVDDYGVLNTFTGKPTTAITCESLIKPIKGVIGGTIRGGAISSSNSMYLGIINSVDGTTHAMHWANQTTSSRLYNWNGSVPDNRWSHLVGTYDGSVSRAYVNGIQIDSWAQNGTIPDATYYVGTYGGTVVDVTHNFDGNIETARIYNKALTSAEIYQNYYGGPIVTSGLTYMWDAGNLVSYEPGAITAYNLAGSKFATLTNGVGFNTANGGHWTFDGSDDAIFIEGSLTSFYLNQGTLWTVNAWIKTTTGVAALNEGGILSNSNGGPVYSNLQVYNGRIAYTHYNNSWQTSQGTITVNNGQWHLLTWANIGDGRMNLYVDGVFDSNVDAQLSAGNAIDVIGRSWAGGSFNGSIANVQVNFITMSQDEVVQNFRAQRNRFGI